LISIALRDKCSDAHILDRCTLGIEPRKLVRLIELRLALWGKRGSSQTFVGVLKVNFEMQ
jgi:hypothetical protein